jgi:thiamine-monophosphate kinase
MDVSDGLATDLLNLCPADCRVELDTDSLPISKDAYHLAEKSDQSPIRHALTDGEDYELLFTVGASINPIEFLQDWTDAFETALTCIGKVITRHSEEDTTIQYRGSQFHSKDHGYEHF